MKFTAPYLPLKIKKMVKLLFPTSSPLLKILLIDIYASTRAYLALASMNSLRGGTSSPISIENV
jgi:hypothetical protein